jgi:hypothetical protein
MREGCVQRSEIGGRLSRERGAITREVRDRRSEIRDRWSLVSGARSDNERGRLSREREAITRVVACPGSAKR